MYSTNMILAGSLLICLLIPTALASCSFPYASGTYDSNMELDFQMVWNDTGAWPVHVNTQSLQYFNLTMECNTQDGDNYIARSTEAFDIHGSDFYVWVCWQFDADSTESRVVIYQQTAINAAADNKRQLIRVNTWTLVNADVCNGAGTQPEQVGMMVKSGEVAAASYGIPTEVWGKYNYQITDTTATNSCIEYNSTLDFCSSKTAITFDSTLCAPTFYSANGSVNSVWTYPVAGNTTYYIYFYNNDNYVDNSATFRFTCVMLDVSFYGTGPPTMTQYPTNCLSSQTASTITTSPGAVFDLQYFEYCPPEGATYYWWVLGLLLGLAVIGAVVGIVYYKCVYQPKKRKRNAQVSPDALPVSGMSAMTADKNYRMMFTPAPPKSAVPGRRGQAAGQSTMDADRAASVASVASLRPTVSALATYRTPSPLHTDGKDVDVDSLLDYDYTTKQNLGDPDGAESGVMLEMEGSIPVYSEPGDTPEPTRLSPF